MGMNFFLEFQTASRNSTVCEKLRNRDSSVYQWARVRPTPPSLSHWHRAQSAHIASQHHYLARHPRDVAVLLASRCQWVWSEINSLDACWCKKKKKGAAAGHRNVPSPEVWSRPTIFSGCSSIGICQKRPQLCGHCVGGIHRQLSILFGNPLQEKNTDGKFKKETYVHSIF